MKYVYPVIFEEDEGKIAVTVPDIPSTYTFGDDMADAIFMAEDAIAMILAHYEDNGMEIPKPSNIKDIKTSGTVSLVVADTDEWRKLVDNKAVKKTLTIPSWLNKKAEKAAINFSQVLQEALCGKLGIDL
ncbi:MAG: HicB family protein [Treponema sp.]|jgi:predicted RNase H-like HicB family nuclease|nr:HicB family protein [Treponema sp.]